MKIASIQNVRKIAILTTFLGSFMLLFSSCGLTETKFEKKAEKEASSEDATKVVDKSDCGTDAKECFMLLIEPDLKANCVGCHTEGVIAGVRFSSSNMDSFRDALLSFIDGDQDKLDNKIRTGPHGGGVHTQPNPDEINQWLVAEGVAKRVVTDVGGDEEDEDKEDEDKEDEDGSDEEIDEGCGETGTECFVKLIQPDFDDYCIGCHQNVNISGVNIDEGNKATYREALLDFIGDDNTSLDTKLRVGPHGGGVINNPTQVKILEWLSKESE